VGQRPLGHPLRSNADDPGPQQDLSLIPFPVQEIFGEQLRTFDAVLFVNFAYAPYRQLDIERFLPNVRDYVRNGGALAMVGGEQSFGDARYGATPLGEVLPVAPIDGSTMWVWIDGAPVGTVTYNLCRGTVGSPPLEVMASWKARSAAMSLWPRRARNRVRMSTISSMPVR